MEPGGSVDKVVSCWCARHIDIIVWGVQSSILVWAKPNFWAVWVMPCRQCTVVLRIYAVQLTKNIAQMIFIPSLSWRPSSTRPMPCSSDMLLMTFTLAGGPSQRKSNQMPVVLSSWVLITTDQHISSSNFLADPQPYLKAYICSQAGPRWLLNWISLGLVHFMSWQPVWGFVF